MAKTSEDAGVDRLRWTEFAASPAGDDGADVAAGLRATPKWLPSRLFYDARGSDLFEEITRLPEYYPTRAELEILEARADEIAATAGPCDMIELGAGSGRKTGTLIRAWTAAGAPMLYLPVDVDGSIVRRGAGRLLDAIPSLEVWGLIGTWEQALAALPPAGPRPRMAVFLGSTLGNLTDPAITRFLDGLRRALGPEAWFLLGVDLVKPVAVLEAAYNDSAGVTAAFNRNILDHINRRFRGDFKPDGFTHRAFWNPGAEQIEMHLESLGAQTARLDALDLDVQLAASERIRTEISRKFRPDALADLFAGHGFRRREQWLDGEGRFALMLFRTAGPGV